MAPIQVNADYVANVPFTIIVDQAVAPFFSLGSGPFGFEASIERGLRGHFGVKASVSRSTRTKSNRVSDFLVGSRGAREEREKVRARLST